ncbi:LysR family transcriptional regulator [Bradyrhizobium sp. GCM10027634]|uniref:LysR family transcriptional regulator n=1 Tax=unclassified Bradyrhizobium TaxID=2631580 RepID=UPI00188A5F77|nr:MULTISPECIES: LysR family transcriptional regulator [unclassified Bradyrhizobium]MDN5001796.1 LysR family transcriptional regulator [Bradyrhizobium sp. WYCCWR 12677]QOZ45892.1 LysR family transcriptional regulator [Bradyrhizobium sp. CCBAU 53340]
MQQVLHRGAAMMQHHEEALNASWDDLKLFLACAKFKSFRNAAEELGVTSTTLMRRIDRLEESIDCKLFLRDQSGLTLSDEGAAMIADVAHMEQHAFNVFRRASRSSNDTSGTVRVAVTEGPGNFWILPRLIDFQKTYRKITVDLRCAMEQADVARLESDIAIQLEPPTNPDLIVAKLGRLHIYPFVSRDYADLYGVPATLAELPNHRIIKQSAPQVDDSAYARVLGLKSLDGIVGIKTNSSVGVLYAVERGAGVGFLPTVSIALGAPLVAIDLGVSHHADLWLTYHKEFRASERHKIVVDWLKQIFDPRTYPCFRDEFVHPNALVPMMTAAREAFGLTDYVATTPA